jgi:hypothetical protein
MDAGSRRDAAAGGLHSCTLAHAVNVWQVDVARWVLDHVAHRRVPPPPATLAGEPPAPEPFVLMKMDTEGAEHACLPRMGFTGALCAVSLAVVELHEGPSFKNPTPGLITDMRRLMDRLQVGGLLTLTHCQVTICIASQPVMTLCSRSTSDAPVQVMSTNSPP